MSTTKRRAKFDGAQAGDLVAIVPRNGTRILISSIDHVDERHIIVDRKLFTVATGTGQKNWYSTNQNDARPATAEEIAEWKLWRERNDLHRMISRIDTDRLTLSQLHRIKAILDESEPTP